MNLVQHLVEQKLIRPPHWLAANTHYLTIMGSIAYGVADTNDEGVQSDFDLYGVCIPPKEIVFPHLAGAVWGFGKYKEGMPKGHFGQYQQHHVFDPSARGARAATTICRFTTSSNTVNCAWNATPTFKLCFTVDL
jgi:hypothetical protein